MNLKALFASVVLLVLASGAAFWLRRPPPPPADDPRTGQPLLDSALVARADQVRITDQAKSVELIRQPDGTWRIPSYYDFPADFAKLAGLMNDLAGAKIKRLVTSRSDRLARLEFKDTTVTLSEKQRMLWRLTLGKQGAYGERYVRFGTEDKGYLTGFSTWLDADPKNWVNHTLMDLKADDIAALELGFPAGPAWTARRAKATDPWVAGAAPAGQVVDGSKVASLLNDFASVSFTETSDPTDANVAAARAHSRTLKFTTFTGIHYTVVVGRRPEEKRPKPPVPSVTPAPAASAPVAATKNAEAKPGESSFETIPAGPVFVTIASSDPNGRVNLMMAKRAFEISEWLFNRLPAKAGDLFMPAPSAPRSPAK